MTPLARTRAGLLCPLRLVLAPLVACALLVPSVVVGQESGDAGKASQKDARETTRQAVEQGQGDGSAQDGGLDGAAGGDLVAPAPVVLTAEEEAEIGPDGKRMAATLTPAPPVLDGIVDDDVWQLAEVVTDFLQREPIEAGQPSQRTEVRILFDDQNLYIGFIMYDDEPGRILAQDLRRDSRLETDDTIAILLDTFHDHRNGFLFRVNPLGTKYDATLKDERDINSRWDERWEAAARITERGWEAELEIPFSVLRFPAGSRIWGVDFKREIRRDNEEVNWSNYRQGFDFRAVSQSGHLVGLRDLGITQRYRLKPYLAGGGTAINAAEDPLRSGEGNFGLETFKIQITPNLTADLTANTDFAQVEDDQERVNLTRFPLFFPERREFFLEGADRFQFGSGGGFGGPSTLLYHSRNIGLFAGEPVPMRYGAKMTGKLGGTSVGFINAQTGDESAVDYPGRNYTTVRLKQDVLSRSSVGMIFTNVQGNGEYNRVAGADASFRFLDYGRVGGYVAAARDSRIEGTNYIGAFDAGWDSDLWSVNVSYAYVDDEFDTEMGFIRRRDMASQNYHIGWKPRPSWSWMRQIMVFASVGYVTTASGEIQDRSQSLWSRYQFESGDSGSISVSRNFERLTEGFSPSGLAYVGPGDYQTTNWRASFESFRARRVSGRLSASGGGYYDGTRNSYGASVTVRFNQRFSLSPRYDFNRVQLPEDGFDTHVAGLRASYNFSERWLTSALVQYNSVSERMSVFARLNFIYRTGDDFFLVYKSTTRYDPEFYGLTDQAVIAKLTRSFDF